ncbi:DUF3412 domain-containing protein [Candidatus Gracilibacteria bacterium]|nr:DUF3412 domain-containing protein [Candidatus Gracilibacteria bacterium]
MSTDIEIPITSEDLGLSEIDKSTRADIVTGIIHNINGVRDVVSTLLQGEEKFIDDIEGLRRAFFGMVMQAVGTNGNLKLVCQDIPKKSLISTEDGPIVLERQRLQIVHAIRDLFVPPPGNPQETVAYIRAMVERAGLLDGDPRRRTFVWGGHRIPPKEYDYAKSIGYYDALSNKTEFITGCGPGAMKAPFKGAIVADSQRNVPVENKSYIGFSEPKIIGTEPPHGLVNNLVMFRNIAERIIAFIGASQRGRAHEGGAGTLHEILTFLSVITHENNRDCDYPLDLLDRSKDGLYMKRLQTYLKNIFDDSLDQNLKFHFGTDPKEFAEYVLKTNKPEKPLWNDDLYFPKSVLSSPGFSFEDIEKIDLSANQPPSNLLYQLEILFNAIIELSFKNPSIVKSWGKERPLLNGDPKIVELTEEFIDSLYAEDRIVMINNQKIFRTK